MKKHHFIFTFFLFCFPIICSANINQTDFEIRYLLTATEKSGCKFIRNGVSYSSDEAKIHLENKLNKSRDKIKTADQFIELIATKSSVTGELYLIECAGSKIPSEAWLKKKLATLRSSQKN